MKKAPIQMPQKETSRKIEVNWGKIRLSKGLIFLREGWS